jgi:hypothetical protein
MKLIDAALQRRAAQSLMISFPGAAVSFRRHTSCRHSFREKVWDFGVHSAWRLLGSGGSATLSVTDSCRIRCGDKKSKLPLCPEVDIKARLHKTFTISVINDFHGPSPIAPIEPMSTSVQPHQGPLRALPANAQDRKTAIETRSTVLPPRRLEQRTTSLDFTSSRNRASAWRQQSGDPRKDPVVF